MKLVEVIVLLIELQLQQLRHQILQEASGAGYEGWELAALKWRAEQLSTCGS